MRTAGPSERTAGHEPAEGGRHALLSALLANLGIAAAKFVAWLFTGSTSMLAEAIHSVADTSKQLMLFVGRWRASRPASPLHQFGYGSERYYWATVVALILFPLGGVASVVEGARQLASPEPVSHIAWAIGTVLAGLTLEGASLRVAVREARAAAPGTSLWNYVRRSREPEITQVILEDVAAVTGLVIALVAIGLGRLLDQPRLDAVGAIAIGALLLVTGVMLAVKMKSLLIGEAATPDVIERLRQLIASDRQVREVIYVRTLHLAPEELLVAAKVELARDLRFDTVAEVIDAIERNVYAELPSVRILHIEPDIYRPERRPPPEWEDADNDGNR